MSQKDRVSLILNHPLYQECLAKISAQEENRIYCRHDLAHFLDTARLAYITVLENNLSYEREIIYAAALLHDIGRAYDNKAHDEFSAEIAAKILPGCGFNAQESSLIITAVLGHRKENSKDDISHILYDADKKSRNCFACQAQNTCKWPKAKQNQTIWR